MSKQIRVNKTAPISKVLAGILGFIGILSTASGASATAFSLDELNYHIEKCFEATTVQPTSTRYCDELLNNRIKPRKVAANAFYNRGVIHFQRNELDNAVSDFTAALKKNSELFEAHLALGEIAIVQQDYNKALEHYDLVIAHSGESKALNKKREGIVKKLEYATRVEGL